jgi:tripartite-type tricarboxylate transporter receptor subunit TctC
MLIERHVILLFILMLTSWCGSVSAQQNYPDRPVRMLSTEAGGFLDIVARLIAQDLGPSLGQPVVVENKSSVITPEIIAKATPDGYTMGIGAGTVWITPLIQKVPYDPIKDYSPITIAVTYPYILIVASSVPVKSVKELVELAKAKPGTLNIAATASPGGASYLAAELFKAIAGINLVRVGYKGNPSGLQAILAGESQLMFNDLGSVGPQVKAGRVRALAVSSLTPFPSAPDLPTMTASGVPGYEVINIAGVLAPAKTPRPVITRLNQEIVRVLNRADVRDKLVATGTGAQIATCTPEQFSEKIKSEMAKWSKVLKDAGVNPEL